MSVTEIANNYNADIANWTNSITDPVVLHPNLCPLGNPNLALDPLHPAFYQNVSACPTPIVTPFAGPNETWCVAKEAFSLVVLKHDALVVACGAFVVGFIWCLILLWLYLMYRRKDDGS